MTQSEITAAVNALLASGQPITASIHRNAEGVIIAEMYNANSRGAVLSGVDTVLSMNSGDKVLLIRGATAKLIDKNVFGSMDGGTP